jgi:hypothetical protein
MIAELNRLFPEWLPFILAKRDRNADYDYVLELQPYYLDENNRKIFLFFANTEDALDQVPSIMIEDHLEIIIRKFPFNLAPMPKEREEIPSICISKSKENVIVACRNQDEVMPPIGLFDYKDNELKIISFDSLEESKHNAGNSCCDNHFTQFNKINPQILDL